MVNRRQFIKNAAGWALGAGGIFVPRLLRAVNGAFWWTEALPQGGSSTLLNGLQVYYALSNTSDATGSGNTLTNHGTTTFVAGKVGNCANFVAASSQYLSASDSSSFQIGTTDFTFSFWIKSTTANSDFMFTYGNPTGSTGYGVELVGGYNFIHIADGTHYDSFTHGASVNDGNWHLLIVTVARAGVETIYIDGSSVGTNTTTATGSVNNSGGFNLGSWNSGGGNFLDGNIDEFGLWNRVLTSTEISHLYNGGSGTTYPFTGL